MIEPGMNPAAKMLYRSEPLRRPVLREIIASLNLPAGSQGLDVGCGIGLQTLLLAEAVGPAGHVTGLDYSVSLLETANTFVRQTNLANCVSFQQGSWNQIPSVDATYDWVWSADAAGYAAQQPVEVIRELARVVKPGGRVVVLFWSSQNLLPGYPALEARLNASRAGMAPFPQEGRPEIHFLRARAWMHEAGLKDVLAKTFVRDISAPLDADLKEALTDLMEMRWGSAEVDVSQEDWQMYRRLCRAESADFILNSPGYYAFFTYSVFSGIVP